MGGQKNVKQLEERSVPEKLKICWVYSVVGALGGFLIWKQTHSLLPFFTLPTTGAIFDVELAAQMRWERKMRKQAERQREIKEREQAKWVCAGAQEAQMGGQKNVEQLEERSVPEKLEFNWVLSSTLALLGLPLSLKVRSLLPIFAFTAGGAILDVNSAFVMRKIKKLHDPK